MECAVIPPHHASERCETLLRDSDDLVRGVRVPSGLAEGVAGIGHPALDPERLPEAQVEAWLGRRLR